MNVIYSPKGSLIVPHVMHVLKSYYYTTEIAVAYWDLSSHQRLSYPNDQGWDDVIKLLPSDDDLASLGEKEKTYTVKINEVIHFFLAPVFHDGKLKGWLMAGPVVFSKKDVLRSDGFYKKSVVKEPPRHVYLTQLLHHVLKLGVHIGPNELLLRDKTFMTAKDMSIELSYASMMEKINLLVGLVIEGNLEGALALYHKTLMVGEFTNHESEQSTMALRQAVGALEALVSHGLLEKGHEPWTLLQIKNALYPMIFDHSDYSALLLCGEQIIMRYGGLVKAQSHQKTYSEPVQKAMTYIQSHFKEKLLIEDICTHVGLSKSALSTKYKAEVGETLLKTIKRKRIAFAKHMMKHSKCTMADIALECGFENQNYFATVFKAIEGISPSAYALRGSVPLTGL